MLTIPQLSCMENFKIAMVKYAKLEGRARRSEFWFFRLFLYGINFTYLFIVAIILYMLKKDENENDKEEIEINIADSKVASVIYILINVFFIIPTITVSVRRLHDVGRSGFYFLLNLIPFIGTLILLYFYLQDSYPYDNEYGSSPKYISPQNDFSRKNPLINEQNELQEIN